MPLARSKGREAAAWKVESETRRDIDEAGEKRVELGDRATESVDKDEEGKRRRFGWELVALWVWTVENAERWVGISRGRDMIGLVGGVLLEKPWVGS